MWPHQAAFHCDWRVPTRRMQISVGCGGPSWLLTCSPSVQNFVLKYAWWCCRTGGSSLLWFWFRGRDWLKQLRIEAMFSEWLPGSSQALPHQKCAGPRFGGHTGGIHFAFVALGKSWQRLLIPSRTFLKRVMCNNVGIVLSHWILFGMWCGCKRWDLWMAWGPKWHVPCGGGGIPMRHLAEGRCTTVIVPTCLSSALFCGPSTWGLNIAFCPVCTLRTSAGSRRQLALWMKYNEIVGEGIGVEREGRQKKRSEERGSICVLFKLFSLWIIITSSLFRCMGTSGCSRTVLANSRCHS